MLQTSTLPKANGREMPLTFESVQVERLTNNDAVEVLEFLAQRPIHTVAMMSMIHDNGIVSAFNRGTFFGCRDLKGQLEGVALVGHATLMETRSEEHTSELQSRADISY